MCDQDEESAQGAHGGCGVHAGIGGEPLPDHPSLADLSLGQMERAAALLPVEASAADLLHWLNLSSILLTRAKEVRRVVEHAAVRHIAAHGPIECGDVRYTVGHQRVVTCVDPAGCTQRVLEAVGGDLVALAAYYRADPFKYGSVRQLLGLGTFERLFRTELRPKLVAGRPQKQLICQNRHFLAREKCTRGKK